MTVDDVVAPAAENAARFAVAQQALDNRVVLRDGPATGLPVIICMWKRTYRLEAVLRTVAQQSLPCDLYLWNNDASQAAAIEATVAAATSAPARVVLASSPENIGGFGRFFWARELAPHHPQVLLVDDDQILDQETAASFVAESAPREIRSAWGFHIKTRRSYWRREAAPMGAPAKYCGTGGMICDSSVFTDERLFRCPSTYWFCEDIWLSYFASTALGWGLYKSGAEVGWLLDEAAQYPGLHKKKNAFYKLLNRKGGWVDPT